MNAGSEKMMSLQEALAAIDHIIDAYEVGDVDPEGSVEKLRSLRNLIGRVYPDTAKFHG